MGDVTNRQKQSRKTTSVNWPVVVDGLLDALLREAQLAGERTSRAELLGALLLHAPRDGQGLGVMIREYRRALVEGEPLGNLVTRITQPGPRRFP